MPTTNIAKHYTRLLSRWPKDPLRPENAFHKLLSARTAKAHTLSDTEVNAELRNVNALYSLLDDRYKKKYPVPPQVLRPTSNPTYYADLIAELEQAPTRSWWQRTVNRWKGFIRWS